MRKWLAMPAAALAVLILVAPAAAETTIQIVEGGQAWRFEPDEVVVDFGETVVWVYNYTTDTSHTVTSTENLEERRPSGLFDATLQKRGDTFSFTFDEEGQFHYYCKPHATFMSGTILVRAAPPPDDGVEQPDASQFNQTDDPPGAQDEADPAAQAGSSTGDTAGDGEADEEAPLPWGLGLVAVGALALGRRRRHG